MAACYIKSVKRNIFSYSSSL